MFNFYTDIIPKIKYNTSNYNNSLNNKIKKAYLDFFYKFVLNEFENINFEEQLEKKKNIYFNTVNKFLYKILFENEKLNEEYYSQFITQDFKNSKINSTILSLLTNNVSEVNLSYFYVDRLSKENVKKVNMVYNTDYKETYTLILNPYSNFFPVGFVYSKDNYFRIFSIEKDNYSFIVIKEYKNKSLNSIDDFFELQKKSLSENPILTYQNNVNLCFIGCYLFIDMMNFNMLKLSENIRKLSQNLENSEKNKKKNNNDDVDNDNNNKFQFHIHRSVFLNYFCKLIGLEEFEYKDLLNKCFSILKKEFFKYNLKFYYDFDNLYSYLSTPNYILFNDCYKCWVVNEKNENQKVKDFKIHGIKTQNYNNFIRDQIIIQFSKVFNNLKEEDLKILNDNNLNDLFKKDYIDNLLKNMNYLAMTKCFLFYLKYFNYFINHKIILKNKYSYNEELLIDLNFFSNESVNKIIESTIPKLFYLNDVTKKQSIGLYSTFLKKKLRDDVETLLFDTNF